ncbi:MAG: hypothetical protein FWF07_01270 [Methanomassiliicoccaceae archaeon]|nr:hypothetical protein [Methanomassiliicoccaceae archaeon]
MKELSDMEYKLIEEVMESNKSLIAELRRENGRLELFKSAALAVIQEYDHGCTLSDRLDELLNGNEYWQDDIDGGCLI